jgi:DNA-binding response OmpR family regulator
MKHKILVVEDDTAISKVLSYNLEKEGYEAVIKANK